MIYDIELVHTYWEAESSRWLQDRVEVLMESDFLNLLVLAKDEINRKEIKHKEISRILKDSRKGNDYHDIGEFLYKAVEKQAYMQAINELGALKNEKKKES